MHGVGTHPRLSVLCGIDELMAGMVPSSDGQASVVFPGEQQQQPGMLENHV